MYNHLHCNSNCFDRTRKWCKIQLNDFPLNLRFPIFSWLCRRFNISIFSCLFYFWNFFGIYIKLYNNTNFSNHTKWIKILPCQQRYFLIFLPFLLAGKRNKNKLFQASAQQGKNDFKTLQSAQIHEEGKHTKYLREGNNSNGFEEVDRLISFISFSFNCSPQWP